MVFRVVCLLLLLLAAAAAQARQKSDVVELINGDNLTGEIKQLTYGKLKLSTDAMGTVSIEWDEVARVESAYSFEFELTSGQRYFGTFGPAADSGGLTIRHGGQSTELALLELVRVEPIEDDFWEQISGSLSGGLNYTKASDVTQFSLSSSTTFRDRDVGLTLDASSIITRDSNDETTQRQNLSLRRTYYRGNRWLTSLTGRLESNDELGLDIRASFGFGVGRYLIQTNSNEFILFGGVQATREALAGDAQTQQSAEAIGGLSFKRYIYDDPSVDVSTSLQLYPSLTDPGRVRAELDARVRYELIDDLFLDLSLYNSYDSDPPSGVEATNDYGIVTSLGWSY